MKYLLMYLFFCSSWLYGQELNAKSNSFIKQRIFPQDTIDLGQYKKYPLKIDLTEFETCLQTLTKGLPLDSVFNMTEIRNQVELNNSFEWKMLDSSIFNIQNRNMKNKEYAVNVKENFTIPIILSDNKIIVIHSWFHSPTYAGQAADIFIYEENEWKFLKTYIFWMS